MMLQGVNLGGWLVLEKWMTPSLFDGTTAADETYFCHDLGEDRARERLKTFRDTFIQRRDFAEIADHGFNAVRIPVPFFIFEDIGPYIHCYEYLDRAFEWAEEFQLKILIDLHTVPGGHNGTDNSGISGICLLVDQRRMRGLHLAGAGSGLPSATASGRHSGELRR